MRESGSYQGLSSIIIIIRKNWLLQQTSDILSKHFILDRTLQSIPSAPCKFEVVVRALKSEKPERNLMSKTPDVPVEGDPCIGHNYTRTEIFQQPVLWPTTLKRVHAEAERLNLFARLKGARVLLTGAGTSAYAAASAASAWPGASAVPTTDLLIDVERYLPEVGVVISLARSGNSPESASVVERIRALCPGI